MSWTLTLRPWFCCQVWAACWCLLWFSCQVWAGYGLWIWFCCQAGAGQWTCWCGFVARCVSWTFDCDFVARSAGVSGTFDFIARCELDVDCGCDFVARCKLGVDCGCDFVTRCELDTRFCCQVWAGYRLAMVLLPDVSCMLAVTVSCLMWTGQWVWLVRVCCWV